MTSNRSNPSNRAPLFYFVTHFYIIHLLAIVFASIQFKKLTLVNPVLGVFPKGFGYDLWVVCAIW